MKGKKKYIIFFGIFVFLLLGIYQIKAIDKTQFFDELLENNEFTIYTDEEINNDDTLLHALYTSSSSYSLNEFWESFSNYTTLNLVPDTCSYMNMTCNFILKRGETINDNYSVTEAKRYNDVAINVVSNISEQFDMLDDNENIVVNYPVSLLPTTEAQNEYVYNYFSSLNSFIGATNEQVSYNCDAYAHLIKRIHYINGIVSKVYVKTFNSVIFDYHEGEFSSDFQQLTSGTLTIKTDSAITSTMIQNVFPHIDGKYFRIDGQIMDNQVLIELRNSTTNASEKHLITLVQDENIDLELFSKAGYGTSVDIYANQPSSNVSDYISNYFSRMNYSYQVGNGYESYSRADEYYGETEYATIAYNYRSNDGIVLDVQFHRIPIYFKGYVDTVSEQYSRLVGDEVVINADELNISTIDTSLNYNPTALGCNEDYSYCDLALFDYDTYQIEIHNVRMILNDIITDLFKNAFHLKQDDSIDIIIGEDINLNTWSYVYKSYYDPNTLRSYNYELNNLNYSNSNVCTLKYYDYDQNITESHNIVYNLVRSNPTPYYSSKIKSSVDVYPGETDDYWNRYYAFNIAKDSDMYGQVDIVKCYPNQNKCSASLINSSRDLEIHNSTINIKEGKSPEFSEIIPGETVKLNSIYRDDASYLRYASMGYLMSKTQTWSYLDDFNEGQAKAIFNSLESHTINVEYANTNEEHKAIVEEAVQRIGDNFHILLDDLDFINHFYYDTEVNYFKPNNYNSKTIYDTLNNIINNKHISYFFAVEGGGGTDFLEGNGGRIILYYDGIAYATTSTDIITDMQNVIYIPDDTPDTIEDYVEAVQTRIDEYLGSRSGVIVSYKEPLTLDVDYIDLTGSDRNVYELSYLGRTKRFLIIKDSSKIKDATFYATDVNNNVNVSSENANYPANTIVSSKKITNNTDYNQLIEKLGLSGAEIIDIDLYSPTIGVIDDFNGVDFNVELPIDKNLQDKELFAYYIGENGNVEEHPITVDDFIGDFQTSHFSTYMISEKIDDLDSIAALLNGNHPNTSDSILKWVFFELLSIIGLCSGVVLHKHKKYN